ncbi:MAG: hydrogenase maturation protein HypF, partial [Solirubrobacteraceae bacterium]|nr:hydrogenase maturation protein HypF [Solirubrobacteraceae bacterium]
GARDAIGEFLTRLRQQAPPLAIVEDVSWQPLQARGERDFQIVASTGARGDADTPVASDTATCADCLAELRDPRDRRFRYPFVNCTNCGPRFTIVRAVPYDRPLTTMAGFAMCQACRAEYEDPLDRRFHAQPNACPQCGPSARLLGADGDAPHLIVRETDDRAMSHPAAPHPAAPWPVPPPVAAPRVADPVAGAAELIAAGAIVAVKGLGGYHLACRADERAAVAALRARKRREDRPFALMVADVQAARRLACFADEELELLRSPARPIVLARRRAQAAVAEAVAPASRELGVMLAYTPLHHVLLADARALGVDALVMTSGNVADEPIAYLDDDALERLKPIADAFLLHDRPVHMRTDDSLARVVQVGRRRRAQTLRRSRGHVPESIALPVAAQRDLLACGAELKNTFCLARGRRAWVGHHIGDLGNWETLRSFREGIGHFQRLFAVSPRLLAHDMHPEYLSTSYAMERRQEDEELALLAVQHHHAHLAAVLAEHGERGPAIGAIYDGAGYGTDGTVWGGELLLGDLQGFIRAGHLRPVRMPGGDSAAREPWRMACEWIAETTGDPLPPVPPALMGSVDAKRWAAVARIGSEGVASPVTTSVGRLCDAVAGLCGAGERVSYEGQAAIELEALADPGEKGRYPMPFERGELDARATISAVACEISRGVPAASVAARFHNTLIAASAQACAQLARERDLRLVVLGGCVFQNRLLLEGVASALERRGLRVLVPERLAPNDGAISYGQAAIAAASARR